MTSEHHIIDGKAFAERLRVDIAQRVAALKAEKGITPGLAVVLVGNNPASEVYVKNKAKQTHDAGMNSFEFKLPETTSEAELLTKVQELNNDPAVHGILVQLPLPKHIHETAIINAISPEKDVDGFHVINAGKLATGHAGFVPCTPLGCMMLLKDHFSLSHRERAGVRALDTTANLKGPHPNPLPKGEGNLTGLHAVIIGRSNIVGKPIAQLLLKENCTVTIVHSKTRDIEQLVRLGDIVIAAVGQPELVKASWLKKGAVVIDVGINRIATPDGKTKLVGDVAFHECFQVASAITPVPGGVGPITIACLLENTLQAADKAQHFNQG